MLKNAVNGACLVAFLLGLVAPELTTVETITTAMLVVLWGASNAKFNVNDKEIL